MKQILQSLRIFIFMTLLLGLIYPLVMTGLAQTVFAHQANGSLIKFNGMTVGSQLIGQKFESPKYFHARPSAVDYNPMPSGGSNLGPTSKKLQESLKADLPRELSFSSASGVDPHISKIAADFQVERVALARGFNQSQREALARLVGQHLKAPDLTFLGEETVNVLELNLAVDRM